MVEEPRSVFRGDIQHPPARQTTPDQSFQLTASPLHPVSHYPGVWKRTSNPAKQLSQRLGRGLLAFLPPLDARVGKGKGSRKKP